MSSIIWWIAGLAVVAALVAVATVFFKAYRSGTSASEIFFKQKPVPRLEVTALASMDGKRKLVLIRRDDVEHLILTGGPVDVVIETGIPIGDTPAGLQAGSPAGSPEGFADAAKRTNENPLFQHTLQPPSVPVFSRPPRAFAPGPASIPSAVTQSVAEAAEAAADLALKR
jgi:flagellar protein FliO/FliZ